MKDTVIICRCADVDHCCIVTFNEEEKEVYLNIHLNKLPFWKRIKYGILYILGKTSKYGCGCFDEVIVDSKYWRIFKKIAYILKPEENKNRYSDKINKYNNKLDHDVHI